MRILKNILRGAVDYAIYGESLLYPRAINGKKRVLILRKDGLGDCLIFFPFLKAYREFYKDAEITLVFPSYFKSLAPLLEGADSVIWFNHYKFSRSFPYRRRFLLDLKRKGFDVAIYPVFTRERMGDLMMKIAEARETIGFKQADLPDGPYTRLIKAPETMLEELARNAFFTEAVTGSPCMPSFPTIDLNLLEGIAADTLLRSAALGHTRFAVVFPGAGAAYRIWPLERFASVIEYLIRRGITPVICGSSQEIALTESILSLLPDRPRNAVIVFTGKTDLPTLAHILSRSVFYFGSDTGILHLAVAVGTPSIALVGSGSIGRFFPYGDPKKNYALYDPNIPGTGGNWTGTDKLPKGAIHPSIESIPVEEALTAVDSVIQSSL